MKDMGEMLLAKEPIPEIVLANLTGICALADGSCIQTCSQKAITR